MGFIIFSASRSESSTLENIAATRIVERILKHKGIPYKAVNGYYKGVHEVSLLVADKHVSLIKQLCQLFEQESYLLVDDNRNAELHFMTGILGVTHWNRLGLWQNVCKSIAESQDSYTSDEHGNYWICSQDLYPRPSLGSRV